VKLDVLRAGKNNASHTHFSALQHQSEGYQRRHARLEEYLQAEQAEQDEHLQLPWITPRAHGRASSEDSQPVLSQRVVGQYGLSPRKLPNVKAGRVASKMDCAGRSVAIDTVMWHIAKDVLAERGVEYDEAACPYFVDKFTGLRVRISKELPKAVGSMHDNIKQNDLVRTPRPAPTTAEGDEEPKEMTSQQHTALRHHLSRLRSSLNDKHTFLDQRLRDLATLKTNALGHAAALAAEDRRTFEVKIGWEMLRLDHEIRTVANRLKKCSKELATVDSTWRHTTACRSPEHVGQFRLHAPTSSPISFMSPFPTQVSHQTQDFVLGKQVTAFASRPSQRAHMSSSPLVVHHNNAIVRAEHRSSKVGVVADGNCRPQKGSTLLVDWEERLTASAAHPQSAAAGTPLYADGKLSWQREQQHKILEAASVFGSGTETPSKIPDAVPDSTIPASGTCADIDATPSADNTATLSIPASSSPPLPFHNEFAMLRTQLTAIQNGRLRLAPSNHPFLRTASPLPRRGLGDEI